MGEFLAVSLLCTELFGYCEVRHDRGVVDGVVFYLVAYFDRVCHSLGDVAEHLPHLGFGLHPLLLGVVHAVRVVKVLACAEANETVVRFGILLIYKMDVI